MSGDSKNASREKKYLSSPINERKGFLTILNIELIICNHWSIPATRVNFYTLKLRKYKALIFPFVSSSCLFVSKTNLSFCREILLVYNTFQMNLGETDLVVVKEWQLDFVMEEASTTIS